MLSTLINKELKSIIQSPKFVGSFAVCSVLILLSVYIGIVEYRTAVAQHEAAGNLSMKNCARQLPGVGCQPNPIARPTRCRYSSPA